MEKFEDCFFDVRWSKPKEGQVMARYRAKAELIDGQLKRDLCNLLMLSNKGGESAQKVFRKLGGACEEDSIKVPLQMAKDLLVMEVEDVCKKSYSFVCEYFFYTDKECVPQNDVHWDVIRLIGIPKSEVYIEELQT